MSDIAEKLRSQFQARVNGEMESREIKELGERVYFRPLTGKQQIQIQKFADKSGAEGVCQYVKIRALDKNGNQIFKDVSMAGMLNDFDYENQITPIYFGLVGADFSEEDIAGN